MLLLLVTTVLYCKSKCPTSITSVQGMCLHFTTVYNEGGMQILPARPPDLIQSEWGARVPGNQLTTQLRQLHRKLYF